MKKLTLLSVCLILSVFVKAQVTAFKWAKNMGGPQASMMNTSMCLDAAGNIYNTGIFTDSADLNPGIGKYFLKSAGQTDAYISKLDSSGNFIWAKRIGGLDREEVNAMRTDAAGNVFITGNFRGKVDFDPGAATHYITASCYQDLYVLKLDASGNFVWVKSFGGSKEENFCMSKTIAIGPSGNICLAGSFQGTVDFDPDTSTYNLTGPGNLDSMIFNMFILNLDANGDFAWAKNFGTMSYAGALSIDGYGNTIVAGNFSGTTDLDPGSGVFNLTGTGSFFLKLDASGNFTWAINAAAAAVMNPNSMVLDVSGNIYTVGAFYWRTDFNPDLSDSFYLEGGTSWDKFISKLDASGNFVWARKIQNKSIYNYHASIALDASNNVYVSGDFQGTWDFNPGPLKFELTATANSQDIFILKLNASGNFISARHLGNDYNERQGNIAVDPFNNIHISGFYSRTVDFDLSSGRYELKAAGGDLFVLKMAQGSCYASNATISEKACGVYTSPSGEHTWNSSGTYNDIIPNYLGCDSLITVNLTVSQPTAQVLDKTACQSYTLNTFTYAKSGTYVQHLTGSNGCDSTLTLELLINHPSAGQLNVVTCKSIVINSQTYNAGGNYTQVLKNAVGCDSVLTIYIRFNLEAKVAVSGNSLVSVDSNVSYQWIDCDNGQPIAGETGKTFTPARKGRFAVIISNGNCTDTSDCIDPSASKIPGNNQMRKFNIYPNPSNGIFNLVLTGISNNTTIMVFNAFGNRVYFANGQNGTHAIDLSNEATGLYIVKVMDGNQVIAVQKLMKQ